MHPDAHAHSCQRVHARCTYDDEADGLEPQICGEHGHNEVGGEEGAEGLDALEYGIDERENKWEGPLTKSFRMQNVGRRIWTQTH